jgi:drug/metabolite transporter (DMT)-like permease
MTNILLYATTVLIWGSTWFAIKLQIGMAPDELSILYRSILASLGLITWCKINKLSLRFPLIDHVFFFLLGLSMFSLHYLFISHATHYIISGIVAMVFSGVGFFSILHNFVFFKVKPNIPTILGIIVGMCGLCLFFWTEVTEVSMRHDTIEGLILSGAGVLIFSLGGVISKRNTNKALAIIPSITLAATYGAIVIFIYTALIKHTQFIIPSDIIYWSSIFYLALFSTIVSSLCYLQIVKNMGPELAGYTAVVSPVIALIISSIMEGYHWSTEDLIALALVIVGNVLVISKKR